MQPDTTWPQQKCCPGLGLGPQLCFWEGRQSCKELSTAEGEKLPPAGSVSSKDRQYLLWHKVSKGKGNPEHNFYTPELGWISAFLCPLTLSFLAWLEAPWNWIFRCLSPPPSTQPGESDPSFSLMRSLAKLWISKDRCHRSSAFPVAKMFFCYTCPPSQWVLYYTLGKHISSCQPPNYICRFSNALQRATAVL